MKSCHVNCIVNSGNLSYKFQMTLVPHPLTLLSAVLVVLAFPPWDFSVLIWICLVPWFFAIQKTNSPTHSFIQSFKEGFWLNFLMTLGGYYWVAYSLKEFGGVPWSVGILGLFFFCLVGQPQFLIIPPLLKSMKNAGFLTHTLPWGQGIMNLIWMSFLYTGIDWIVPKMFLDTLGHALYESPLLRQAADLGGAQILTFVIVLINISFYEVIKTSLKEHRVKLPPHLLLSATAILAFLGYGWARQAYVLQIIGSADTTRVQMAAIQGNIGDFDKIAAENGTATAALKIIDTLTAMTDRAFTLSPRPEIIIWPETSFPSMFRQPLTQVEVSINEHVERFVRDRGIPLLFGGYDRQYGKEFNSFFFLQPNGQLQIYHKSKLLMFGEYIPGADTFRFFKDAFPQVGNFGHGPGPQVLNLDTQNKGQVIRIAPIICYEALFTNFLLESARNNSQMILNITNDSWFGPWGEPQLHLALTAFRSIETRLPMLRSTNTGISTLITADGTITHPTGIGTQEIMNVSVPLTPPIESLVKLWGDWFGPFALLMGLLGLGIYSPFRKLNLFKIFRPRSRQVSQN
jgi:apolipoprotein N-acyltransferase